MSVEIKKPISSELVEDIVKGYLTLGPGFEKPPVVTLQLLSQKPPESGNQVNAVDIAASTAIQCYAPGVAALKPRPDAKSQAIAQGTLDAGHHTTRMHGYYTW